MPAKFVGNVVVIWLTQDGPDRDMQLVEDFAFLDAAGKNWPVPAGTKINGASIPQFLWSFGPPFVGDYRRASVVHDYYCEIKTEPWKATHRMFYEGCRVGGVDATQAKLMFKAVYIGGPSWPVPHQSIFSMTQNPKILAMEGKLAADSFQLQPELSKDESERIDAWIRADDPSLDEVEAEIDKHMDFAIMISPQDM